MPAYNFKRQFAGNVVAGLAYGLWQDHHGAEDLPAELKALLQDFDVMPYTPPKRQTIRLCRKRPTKPGETLYLFTGMRQKGCIRLGKVVCKRVRPLRLQMAYDRGPFAAFVVLWKNSFGASAWLVNDLFARADGFENRHEMQDFFEKTHGLPFTGELITW